MFFSFADTTYYLVENSNDKSLKEKCEIHFKAHASTYLIKKELENSKFRSNIY